MGSNSREADEGLGAAERRSEKIRFDSAEQTGEALRPNINEKETGETGQAQQHQLDKAPHARAPGSPEDHVNGHQDDGDGDGRQHSHRRKQHGDKAAAGHDLSQHADKDADGAEGGAQLTGFAAILSGNDGQLRHAAGFPEGPGVEQGQEQSAEAGAQGEPPGGEPVVKGQLSGADGGLTGDQRPHDAAADQQTSGLAAAGGKILRVGNLAAGADAHADDQGHDAHQTQDMLKCHVKCLLYLLMI